MCRTDTRIPEDPVPWRLQLWLNTVFSLAERVTSLAAATLSAKRWSGNWLASSLPQVPVS